MKVLIQSKDYIVRRFGDLIEFITNRKKIAAMMAEFDKKHNARMKELDLEFARIEARRRARRKQNTKTKKMRGVKPLSRRN